MEIVDECLDDAINSILLQTNPQVQIHAILYPIHNCEYEEKIVLERNNKPSTRKSSACHVDTFYLSVIAAEKRYANILVGDVPRLQNPDSSRFNYHQEAVKKIENDAGYMLRRLMKSGRQLIFTSNLMNLKREMPTKELVDKLCPDDDLKKSSALQYDFLNQQI